MSVRFSHRYMVFAPISGFCKVGFFGMVRLKLKYFSVLEGRVHQWVNNVS